MTTPFDITAALPTGRATLEASAGTGKTFTIVGLATRFLAEGRCTARELLVVTFARSATRELRARLLGRLADGLDLLTQAVQHRTIEGKPEDPVDQALLDTRDPAQLLARRDRLADALADIDQATISTIHGFCADTLTRLGDVGLGELLEDRGPLCNEIAADLYLRAVQEDPGAARQLPYFDMYGAELVSAGMDMAPADILPDASLKSWDGARAWLAVNASVEATRRKTRRRQHTYDDLLRRLADRLSDPTHGPGVVRQVGGGFRVGLVDEFQDTDPVQWQIFSRLFPDVTGQDGRCLVLVGDPKQAIYSFRGADVNAYVLARGQQATYLLPTNFRSDQPLVTAVLALFSDRPLGRQITVPSVTAAYPSRVQGLDAAPVTFRLVADDAPIRRTDTGGMQLTSLRDHVAADVAVQAATLLSGAARILGGTTPAGGSDGAPQGRAVGRQVGPADLAILVRTRRQAALVQRHLVDVGVPSVLNGVGNVLASSAARQWGHLLRALDRPASSGLARLAAMTDLIGWTPAQVATAAESDWDRVHINLHRWRQILLGEGVAAATRHLSADTRVSERLLAQPDGDRRLTDLTHVAELLHTHSGGHVTSTAGLMAWLQQEMAQALDTANPTPPDNLASRLERAGDAVQIMTVHGAKGLQFPIVFAPYLWDSNNRLPVALRFHDHTVERTRLYVGSNPRSPDFQHYRDLHAQQAEEEERRLAYVAATRAKHHLRVWWAPAPQAAGSPLGTLLARSGRIDSTAAATASIDQLAQANPDLFGVAQTNPDQAVSVSFGQTADPPGLELAEFTRVIDRGWRRASYSRLVGDADAAADAVSSGSNDADSSSATQSGTDDLADERVSPPPIPADPDLPTAVLLSDLRGGADIGTMIHAVLEHVDFASPDLPAELAHQIQLQAQRHAVDLGDEQAETTVVQGLTAAVRTPLGPGGAMSLKELSRSDRLDEMAFELPVLASPARHNGRPGTPTPDQTGWVLLSDVADLLDVHLSAEDLLAPYAAVLRHHLGGLEVRGFLAGFIDLVARMPDGAYLVADYKTNRLAPAGTDPLTVGSFTPASMAAEMMTHHYPLQALIYVVAVHRYLRWRVADYDPGRHLAGVAYLFVRGMIGPETPIRDDMRCGVFVWHPPTELILALDRLLADGITRGEG
ncbi:MAG: UvrD-helicase domain-containing protein [Euzebya sp.]